MNRMLLTLALTAAFGGLLAASPSVAQGLPPAKKAAPIDIIQGPALETARPDLAIIRWTTRNPFGTDIHFGIVHYGTDPKELSKTAKSPIRINRSHREAVFRVRLAGLRPATTYYYSVASMESNGASDRVRSAVKSFTTPAPADAGPMRALRHPRPRQ